MRYRERLESGLPVTAVFVGDSHAWGQGATGALEGFDPPAVSGELRPTSFDVPHFVNRFRDWADRLSGSSHEEREGFSDPCSLEMKGRLARFLLKASPDAGAVRVVVDGAGRAVFVPHDAEGGPNAWRVFALQLGSDGLHRIECAHGGALRRVEAYAGPSVVLNAGVGSCPAPRYLERCWEPFVMAARPDLVVIEAFSINDWLAGTPIGAYVETLAAMCERARASGAEAILATVPPIGGVQETKAGAVFGDYVEASRAAARCAGVPLADANRASQGLPDLLADRWHPNDAGHRIYFETIVEALTS